MCIRDRYTPKQTNDDHSNANVPKLIIGEGHNMKNAKVYEAEQTAVKDEQEMCIRDRM